MSGVEQEKPYGAELGKGFGHRGAKLGASSASREKQVWELGRPKHPEAKITPLTLKHKAQVFLAGCQVPPCAFLLVSYGITSHFRPSKE